jgi:two-component system CheB/CheR fusion protein
MAAKKRTTRGAKAPESPQPAQQPTGAGEPAGEVPETPGDAGPAEGRPRRPGPPVAGIGASAGGLDAFRKFFAAMPPDSGIAFVLVPHLDPARESLLAELLARHTALPVVEAQDGTPVEANRVYVLPPNKYMTIRGGALRLTGPVERHAAQTSIDLFLRSLADDQQERSICIILSGTGSHGALGLKAVKAAGGMAVVQDPATAAYQRMPQSAVDTGLADCVLPPERMPEALIKYVRHTCGDGGTRTAVAPEEAADHLTQVLALLRARAGLDFSDYRKKMLTRRVERRMRLNRLGSAPEYVKFLREHPGELSQLAKDLFISVSSFFRDPEAFEQLAGQALAPLVQGKQDDAVIRVWVPGCATGEEAYSVAMLLLEQLAEAHKSCQVQIFATDVDEDAVRVARKGLYPDGITADVSSERLAGFFTKVDDHTYRVNGQARETITFAVQNLTSDAPFTRLDLVSCRNLLIYLEPDVQKKVLKLLHFALREGGFLFLGPSETVGRQTDLFEPVSKKWRIYRRVGPARPECLVFPAAAATEVRGAAQRPLEAGGAQPINFGALTRQSLLEEFAPAAVLINRDYEIVYYFGPCARYLEFPPGQPNFDLTLMAREGLRARLPAALHRAARDNQSVVLTDVRVNRDGGASPVRVTVRPVRAPKAAEGLLLITFEDEAPADRPTSPPGPQGQGGADGPALRQLEQELKATHEELQGTIEELESSNEELKAANEEILSMNEELQSINEELEASKEQLQTLNEELGTVNDQLQEKIDELETANNHMANLLNCMDAATVFLDGRLRIMLFTPNTRRLFNLIATDVGRPFRDIAPKVTDPELQRDAEEVLHDFAPREKEVAAADGRWYLRRIVPYRTLDHRIDGVVLTFVDVTERKLAADQVVRRLAAVVESSADAIFSKDLDGAIRTWNRGAERLYGYTSGEAVGRSVEILFPEDRAQEFVTIMDRLRRGEAIEHLETERVRKDGQRVAVALTVSPVRDGGGKVVSASVIARDVTERKRAEVTLRLQGQVAANLAEGVGLVRARDGVIVYANERYEQLFGYGPGELLGRHVSVLNAGEGGKPGETAEEIIRALRQKGVWKGEVHNVKKDGAPFWTYANVSTFEHPEHGTVWIGALADITERKAAESALHASEERLRAILSTASDAIITIDHRGIIRLVNAATERMFGYTAAEMIGQSLSLLMPSPYREAHAGYLARYLHTGEKHVIGTSREVEARRKDGSVFPTDLSVSEIEHLKLFTGIHRDLTERKRLEREVVEAASQEQRRIGQDLHDTVAQELTALNLLARDLAEDLRTDPAHAARLVGQMGRGLQRSQDELRAVLRGLLPVAVDSEGLMAALADLCDRTRQEGKVACTFDCPAPVAVADNLTATHLYLIAQEAVHNAVKHARARQVRIRLTDEERLALSVQDDGTGMPAAPTENQGLGLRIMRNRAAIIGAALTIGPARPTGTVVTCALPRKNHEPEQGATARPGPDRR